VTLVDPCVTTVLSLPALSTFTISAFDGIGFTQTFTPASDTASSTAAVPGLCGTVSYLIVETQPSLFMTIVPPVTSPFTNLWTLTALSSSFADVGAWAITLQATLVNYPTIVATSVINPGTVQDPCLGTVIQPGTLTAMTVTIYDSVATVQSFFAWADSFSVLMATPGICGPKTYTSNQGLAILAAPTSGLLDTDYWTISTFTNLITDVSTYTVTISATMTNYPTVTAGTATYTLTVVDPCSTVVMSNTGQTLASISYVVVLAAGPSTQTFVPFSDNAAVTYSNPSICGPKAYSILEGYSFVSITPPASGLDWTDPWLLSVQTTLLSDVGVHAATIQATMTNYPSVPPVTLVFSIVIIHPCQTTQIVAQPIMDMYFYLPTDTAPIHQTYS
jgi:hypothetical protein